MKAIHPIKAAVTLGVLIGGWHLCWAILVALGWAQPFINFVFWIHFIQPVYVVGPFDAIRAAILIIVTTSMGLIIGYIFSVLWNRLHLY
jgi:hypothetical protein